MPLGVVHAIDTYTEKRRFDPQFQQQRAAFFLGIGARLAIKMIFNKVDTDRKRQYRRSMLVALDCKMLPGRLWLRGCGQRYAGSYCSEPAYESPRSAPSRAVKQFRCQGQMLNDSALGQGMCQKIATLALGNLSLSMRGRSAKW